MVRAPLAGGVIGRSRSSKELDMRVTSTLFLIGLMATACSHNRDANARAASSGSTADDDVVEVSPSTPSAAVASGGETPCGSAQVFFTTGSSELDAAARERLDVYAGCLARREIDVVYIAGMTDPAGTEHDNLVLGRARALAVADYLHGQGVSTDFVVRTLGEAGAVEEEPLWPIERSAEATAVATP
jgi:outer membrane protein OmpA-like peptidoglycan-associated protein